MSELGVIGILNATEEFDILEIDRLLQMKIPVSNSLGKEYRGFYCFINNSFNFENNGVPTPLTGSHPVVA